MQNLLFYLLSEVKKEHPQMKTLHNRIYFEPLIGLCGVLHS
ncbi:MAG: hypothetical protein NZ551_09945 [Microscillaceae bacterium]|nr:hypothetical protein [Microscillaceae bacterium]MDW8461518.1 hypothetical protein [Cytophagales bacterium]